MTRHPFAHFVRTLGRGANLSRSLTRDEATEAMRLILDGAVEPVQLGAFLMLLRYRGETAEELAGFTLAARERMPLPSPAPAIDLDWPTYADRHRQLPWFVLAALLLAENGTRVLMHGIPGEEDGFVTTRAALQALGIPVSSSLDEAARGLGTSGFAYLALEGACPELEVLFHLRPLLGLRSPVHSVARELNPLRAPCQMQGVFHPGYRALHQETAWLLGQERAAVFKGGGGEAQRNPDKPCLVALVRDGERLEEEWPALPGGAGFRPREEALDPKRIAALWRGEIEEAPGPVAAVTGTLAIALRLLGKADGAEEAQALAERMWHQRASTARSEGVARVA